MNLNSSTKPLFTWELIGAFFIAVLGTLFHFLFEWSGNFTPFALVFPVNESTWEHFKLAFWPSLLWAFVERRCVLPAHPYFWAVKGLALLSTPILIVFFLFAYKTISDGAVLWLDILSFYLAVFWGQLVSYRLLLSDSVGSGLKNTGIIVLLLQISAYLLLTFFPLNHQLFIDPRNGMTGILLDE